MKNRPILVTLLMYACAAVAISLLLELAAAVLGLNFVRLTVDDVDVNPPEFLMRVGIVNLVKAILLLSISGAIATHKAWTRELVVISCGFVGAVEWARAFFSDTSIKLEFTWLVGLLIAHFYFYRSFEGQSYYASLQSNPPTHSDSSQPRAAIVSDTHNIRS